MPSLVRLTLAALPPSCDSPFLLPMLHDRSRPLHIFTHITHILLPPHPRLLLPVLHRVDPLLPHYLYTLRGCNASSSCIVYSFRSPLRYAYDMIPPV